MRLKWTLTATVLGLALLGGCGTRSANSVRLQGAGATFPEPLYTKWFKNFSDEHPEVQIAYDGVGSGTGKKKVIDGNVDFGASDAAMKPEEMEKVEKGVVLLPMTAGAIVLIYNLDGVDDLRLSREVYSDIFLGKIKNWNDPKIAKDNPKTKLPDQPITVVVRGDKSGTTFVFTTHLSAISPEFKKKVGAHEKPSWPRAIEGQGNGGVTAQVKQNPGAIGYVEFSYGEKSGKPMAILENGAGKFVKCTPKTSQAALESKELPENLIAWMPDPAGDSSYPIVTYTWMIFYKTYDDEKKYKAIQDLIKYCLDEGQKISVESGYIRLPDSVIAKNKEAAKKIKMSK
jgi:phosphate transport system substrate-binding protein